MEYKIGIVLSGGGARGIAHLSVLKVMEECGLKPDIISGTSAGSMVGAFYNGGYSIEDIIKIIENHRFFRLSNILFRKQGVFAMNAFEHLFQTYFPNNNFDDLAAPLYVAATDILKGQTVYFSSGNLAAAVMASSCIPIVFQPLNYQDTVFVDGGVLNNFPLEPLKDKCEIIIGSNVNSLKQEYHSLHMKDIMDRSYHLAMSFTIAQKKKECNLFIEPPNMSQFSIFDTSRSKEIYDYGYQYASTFKDQFLALKERLAA